MVSSIKIAVRGSKLALLIQLFIIRNMMLILSYIVDGNWGGWSSWSTCSKTCKQGQQWRGRKCNSPAPKYDGKTCAGEPKQIIYCNANVPCPGRSFPNSQKNLLIRKSRELILPVRFIESNLILYFKTIDCIGQNTNLRKLSPYHKTQFDMIVLSVRV